MLRFTENNEVIRDDAYRAILVGLQTSEDISYSMEELKGLAEAANVEVLGQMIQNLERPNTATLIGKGKVEELAEMVKNMEADTVIFNDELTGMQLRNLEDAVGVRVIDRTILILDIFAARANSREGKLQVELAQLAYRMPRLTGFGKSLSRLGGGIGTRGPGEKKLETDRRHIERRMYDIKAELSQLKNTRSVQRARREKSEIPVVALVGYTNSGKSALMNRILAMTEKEEEKAVFEKNMLFATLDTQQRSVVLDTNHQFILVDTVGFVSKLPHALVDAFKATLEEVCYADLLLHVPENVLVPAFGAQSVSVSAKYGTHMDELLKAVKAHIFRDEVRVCLLIPYTKGDVSSYLCEKAKVNQMDYRADGTWFDVELKEADYQRLKEYEVTES